MNNLGDMSLYIMILNYWQLQFFLKGKIDIVDTINLNVAIQEIRVIKNLTKLLKEFTHENTNNKISKLTQMEKNWTKVYNVC